MPGPKTAKIDLEVKFSSLYKIANKHSSSPKGDEFFHFIIKHPDIAVAQAPITVRDHSVGKRSPFSLCSTIIARLKKSLEMLPEDRLFLISLADLFCEIFEKASFEKYQDKVDWQCAISGMLVVAAEQKNCCIEVIKKLAGTLPMLDSSYKAGPDDSLITPSSTLLANLSRSIKKAIRLGHVETAKFLLNIFKEGYKLRCEEPESDKWFKTLVEAFVEASIETGHVELVEFFVEIYVAECEEDQGDVRWRLQFWLRTVREKFSQLDRRTPDLETRNAYRSSYASVMLFLCRYSVESKLLQQETDKWEARKRESEQLRKSLGTAAFFCFSPGVEALSPLKSGLQETLIFSAREGLLPIVKLLLPHLDNADQVLQVAAERGHPSIVYECLSVEPERRAELNVGNACCTMLQQEKWGHKQFLQAIFGDQFTVKNIGVLRIKLLPLGEQSQVPVMEKDNLLRSFVADFLAMYRALRDNQPGLMKTDKWSKVNVAAISDEQLMGYAGWIASHGVREPGSRTGGSLRLLSLFYTGKKDLVDLFGEIHLVANPSRVCISSAMHRPQLTQQSGSVAAPVPA
jgi:hypothetical protein